MRYLLLLMLAALANCAAGKTSPGAAWPTLAKRAVESAPRSDGRIAAAAPGTGKLPGTPETGPAANARRLPDAGVALAAGAGEPSPVADSAARLITAARDIDSLEQRWRTQLAATQHALAAARMHPDADAAATAQLETGRLDKLAGQVADQHAQIESIAGELAVAAAAGADVATPLRKAGTLLARCASLTADDGRAGGSRAEVHAAGPR